MSNLPEQRPAEEPAPGHAPAVGKRLRVANPEVAQMQVSGRIARTARLLNAWLIFTVVANVMIVNVSGVALDRRIAGAFVAGCAFLWAFRSERRNGTFARLSGLAQAVYRTRAAMLGAAVLASVAYFVPWLGLSPRRIALSMVLVIAVSAVWSALTRDLLGGRVSHRTLVIGDGEQVGRLLAEFAADPHPEYVIVGLLTESASTSTASSSAGVVEGSTTLDDLVAMFDDGVAVSSGGRARVLGNLDDLETVLAAEAIDTVVVAAQRNRLELFSRLSGYTASDITVQELPAFSEYVFGRVPIDVINAAWFMHMVHPFFRPYSRAAKRFVDVVMAAAIGLLALPIIPFAALAVRLSSPGPILYKQRRVGEHGREFTIAKFRTMGADAEAGGAQWAQKHDPRVTRVGAIFRSTRIDELPQLWNILAGHMSFVGPRPERPEFVTELEQSLPYYQRRHMVKPGLTGWAQVRLGYTDTIDGAANKLGYELYYLKHQSLLLDLIIFVETIRVVLLRFGSR